VDSPRDPIEEIKKFSPRSLKVTLRDGTEKPVAVPQAGNRWARTSQVLSSLSWARIECLDKDGRVVGVVEDEDDDQAAEEYEDEAGGNIALARILLDVMRTTMKETRQLVDAQLRGNAEMVSAMTDGMRATADVYRQALQVQQAYLLAPPGKEGADDTMSEMMKMMQMGMMLSANKPPKVEGPK